MNQDYLKALVNTNATYLEVFGITLEDVVMTENDLVNDPNFLKDAKFLKENQALNKIIKHMVNIQTEALLKYSDTPDKDIIIRGTVNGLFLLKSTLEDLAAMYDDNQKLHDQGED